MKTISKSKIVAAAGLLLISVTSLTSCSEPAPTSGVIVSKKHTPASTTYYNQCVSYGANGGCSSSMMMPLDTPEKWKINISSGESSGWVDLSEKGYELCEPGMNYPDCIFTSGKK